MSSVALRLQFPIVVSAHAARATWADRLDFAGPAAVRPWTPRGGARATRRPSAGAAGRTRSGAAPRMTGARTAQFAAPDARLPRRAAAPVPIAAHRRTPAAHRGRPPQSAFRNRLLTLGRHGRPTG